LGGDGNRTYTLLPGHNRLVHWYNDEESGIFSTASNGQLAIYPNPVSNQKFTVSANYLIETVTIYSLKGELIYRELITLQNNATLNCLLAKGMYLVKVSGSNKELITKLMVY